MLFLQNQCRFGNANRNIIDKNDKITNGLRAWIFVEFRRSGSSYRIFKDVVRRKFLGTIAVKSDSKGSTADGHRAIFPGKWERNGCRIRSYSNELGVKPKSVRPGAAKDGDRPYSYYNKHIKSANDK